MGRILPQPPDSVRARRDAESPDSVADNARILAAPKVRDLLQSFNARVPIFGLSHSPSVVSAISNAGGIGVFAAARLLPHEIIEESERIRRCVGERVFGLNLMLPENVPSDANRAQLEAQIPQEHRAFVESLYGKYHVPREDLMGERNRIVRSKAFFEEQIVAAASTSADFFAMAIGASRRVSDVMRSSGKRLVGLVGSPRHVSKVMDLGADMIVAQGYDAGGHTGRVGTFTLVPKVVEMATPTPVLAAGGIGTGSQIAASIALGAAGVWLGTAWLATEEFAMPEALLRKLLGAGCEDTVLTRASSGKWMRQLRTAWSDEWSSDGAPAPLGMPWQDLLVGSLEGSVSRHLIEPLMYTPAGQSVEWVRERSTVRGIIERLMVEADEAFKQLGVV